MLHRIIINVIMVVAFLGSAEGSKGKLVMGTSADYPPFEYKDQANFKGIDIDIAKAITNELGYELEISDIEFGSLVGAVKSGRVDFVMASLTMTPERVKNIDFSDTYYNAELSIIYNKGRFSIQRAEDLANKKIGVQLGSMMEAYLNQLASKVPGIAIKPLNRNPELVQELKLGRIDAVLIEEAQAIQFVDNDENLLYRNIPHSGEGYAIGFRKGSPLKGLFNTALEKLREKGELHKIKKNGCFTKKTFTPIN